jgi:hypothetical protein
LTRLNRVIKGFNDYDNLVKQLLEQSGKWPSEIHKAVAESKVNKIRAEASALIGELKRYGCRRKD